MSDGSSTEQLKKFVFTSKPNLNGQPHEHLEIIIPELLQASYSFYTWPSAPVLAWFLWEHRHELPGKSILELGAGTALPGIVAAKCGARVTLSESLTLPKSLLHTRRSCEVNNLIPDRDIRVVGLSWGLYLDIDTLGLFDLVIASDCFYEPTIFEDILSTVAFLLSANKEARFLCTYQERSSDWSIEHLLAKWGLVCRVHDIGNLGSGSGFNLHHLAGDHTIHLLEIKLDGI